jgi:hypothetical protein
MPPEPEWIPTTNLLESILPMETEIRNEGSR